jgi:hypothetical protein
VTMKRMPNPADVAKEEARAQRRDMRRLGALLLAEARHQTVLLQQLVDLGLANKAALDSMQQPDPFSVAGLAKADDDSPYIGG